MSGFKIDNFGGVIPRLGTRLLPNSGGQIASNVKLFSGELRSWFKPLTINTPTRAGTLQSLYRMYTTATDIWLTSTDDVDYVRGPIAGDTSFKLYYTGETSTGTNYAAGPRKTNLMLSTSGGGTNYPNDWLEMGVPAPATAPAVIGTGGTSTNSVSRAYTYTFVTSTASWAEEGPPSSVGTGTGKEDATWVVSNLSTGTTGKYAFGGGIKRIYRTLTDSAGNTNYQLALDNVPMATTSTADAIADENLGVICPTFVPGLVGSEWVAPPSDMKGLLTLPNGILVGFSGNLICFSEPFYPHAWPIRYRLATNFNIIGMGHYGQTLIVATKGFPYAVTGSRPDAMSMAMIEENHPCVSKRGVVSFPWGVAWPTPDGLALAGVGGAVNTIEQFMKRDEWRALCFPETIMAKQFENVYFGFFNNGGGIQNFVFDKTNQQGPLTFGRIAATGAWTDPETSRLYLIQNNVITQWDADLSQNDFYDWQSKTVVLQRPVNLGAIQVDADYGHLVSSTAGVTSAAATDLAINQFILGTGQIDTAGLSAWGSNTVYTTGTSIKSVDGIKMAVCLVAGTSTNAEPTWSSTLGGTSTDGPTLKWKRVWDINGVTKGDHRGHILRSHVQFTTADPLVDGTAGNQWGFPLRGGLLVGGYGTDASSGVAYGGWSSYAAPSCVLKVYAMTTGTQTTLVHQQNLTNREIQRIPKGFKSDTWEVRLSGSINVRYFKIAQTAKEIGQF